MGGKDRGNENLDKLRKREREEMAAGYGRGKENTREEAKRGGKGEIGGCVVVVTKVVWFCQVSGWDIRNGPLFKLHMNVTKKPFKKSLQLPKLKGMS
jgi:hypothetical protein